MKTRKTRDLLTRLERLERLTRRRAKPEAGVIWTDHPAVRAALARLTEAERAEPGRIDAALIEILFGATGQEDVPCTSRA